MKAFNRLTIIIMLGLMWTIDAQTPDYLRGHNQYRRIGTMDGNLVQTLFKNYGEVTDYPNEPSCNWPSYGRHYCDGVALIVSVEVQNRDGEFVHPMETQYREFTDTSPEGDPWGFEPRPYWFNMDGKENKTPAMSNDPKSWPDQWLDRPDSWDGYWNGYFGKGIFNAQLETVFAFDDDSDKEPNLYMNYYCDDNDTTRGGLGLWVKARGFQWSQVLAEDCIFWLFNITNESTHDYTKVYYAQYVDWGIGGVEDGADDIGEYDTDLDIAFAYDTDRYGTPGNWYPVGYAGYAFLESPGISDDNIDNDNDGMVDENRFSETPGHWVDEDSLRNYEFAGERWNQYVEAYGTEPKPHWSNDEDCDWRPFTDLNANGVWDADEPLNDDLGIDGAGPFDASYTGPDEGEGDGLPTNGEPNYNATDPDESDQIGLTGFRVFAVHDYELTNDEQNWRVFVSAPTPWDQVLAPNNLGMFFSSGPFPLYIQEIERYSMALLFGEDKADLVKNKKTVQQIYNADYRFSQPPDKPHLTIYPGDGKVTLVWDDIAEKSYDPFLQEFDFEGYVVYKSTEAQLLESKIITDTYGNLTYRKPEVQFDKKDGLKGPHPVAVYGIQYNLGEDTGLRHSWVDTDVRNGQTYYYAVVSYDYGLVTYTSSGVEGIAPSECSAIIKANSSGEITFVDVNCGVVTPRSMAAGYQAPKLDENILHVGPGTGYIEVEVLEDSKVPDNDITYELEFFENTKHHTEVTPYFSIRDVAQDTIVVDSVLVNIYGGESPTFNGSVVSVFNDTSISWDIKNSGWIEGYSDYTVDVRLDPAWDVLNMNLKHPARYYIVYYDSIVTTSRYFYGLKSYPSSVMVYDVTYGDSVQVEYAIADNDTNQQYSNGDDIVLLIPDDDAPIGNYYRAWTIRFDRKLSIDSVYIDGVGTIDTTWITTDPPEPGEVYQLEIKRPFRASEYMMVIDTVTSNGITTYDTSYQVSRQGDVYRFTVKGASYSKERAKDELENICVVPNPYVVTASWEPKSTTSYGRGERRIQFMHLPKDCTIRVYSLSGHLIRQFEHHGADDDGMESWDLLSKDGNEISYGIYLFHVEAPGVGEKIGRFAIIK